jgi:hypothetical protein
VDVLLVEKLVPTNRDFVKTSAFSQFSDLILHHIYFIGERNLLFGKRRLVLNIDNEAQKREVIRIKLLHFILENQIQ